MKLDEMLDIPTNNPNTIEIVHERTPRHSSVDKQIQNADASPAPYTERL